METFVATIRKVDINPYVRVPATVLHKLQSAAKKERGPIPVMGLVEGKPFAATVVKFRGIWRLYLNTEMRRAADCDVGDEVRIEVKFDGSSRSQAVPASLKLALSKNATANETFKNLRPSRQREILSYLNSLKSTESLERNIERLMDVLLEQN